MPLERHYRLARRSIGTRGVRWCLLTMHGIPVMVFSPEHTWDRIIAILDYWFETEVMF